MTKIKINSMTQKFKDKIQRFREEVLDCVKCLKLPGVKKADFQL